MLPEQVTPLGVELMLPLPVPASVTVRAKVWRVKVAVTLWACDIVTVQGSAVQAPLQPVNVEPVAGVAVRVTL